MAVKNGGKEPYVGSKGRFSPCSPGAGDVRVYAILLHVVLREEKAQGRLFLG